MCKWIIFKYIGSVRNISHGLSLPAAWPQDMVERNPLSTISWGNATGRDRPCDFFGLIQYLKTIHLNKEPKHFFKIKNQKDEEYFFIFLIKK
jgi:hypothetical protein